VAVLLTLGVLAGAPTATRADGSAATTADGVVDSPAAARTSHPAGFGLSVHTAGHTAGDGTAAGRHAESVTVAGVDAGLPTNDISGALPVTGAAIATWLRWAGWLVLAGVATRVAVRRRSSRSDS
jgi:hypothetical protein